MKTCRLQRAVIAMLATAGISMASFPAYAFGPGEAMTAATAAKSETGTIAPMGEAEEAALSALLKETKTAEKASQILLLLDHRFMLWEKQEDGSFQKRMEAYAGYGRNGLKPGESRVEGDGTTPIGSFPVLFAFGQKESAPTEISYRQITENSYWSGEEESYNTWVESTTPIGGEHLSDYQICYEYALALGFNMDPVVYKRGSAIFLHIKDPSSWESSGCISLERADLLQLFGLLKQDAYVLAADQMDRIAEY